MQCFDKSNPRTSPYGSDCQNNNFCHAWSYTPSYFLRGPLAKLSGTSEREMISLEELDQERISKISKQSMHERLQE